MTKTEAAAQLDLDSLEALARAATPGPWAWWTSNSMLRLTGADGVDGGVVSPYYVSGHADLSCSTSDQAFIAALNPAIALALIALARQQPAASGAGEVAVNIKTWRERMDPLGGFLEHHGNQIIGYTGSSALIAARDAEIAELRAMLAAAPHAQAEPAARARLEDGWRDTLPPGVKISAFQAQGGNEWRIAIRHPFGDSGVRMGNHRDIELAKLLAAPVPQEAEQKCTGCDPAEGFCKECREAEQAAPAAVTDGPWRGSIEQIICDVPLPKAAACFQHGFVSAKEAILAALKATQPAAPAVTDAVTRFEYQPRHENGMLLDWVPLAHVESEQEARDYCAPFGFAWRAAPAVTDAARDVGWKALADKAINVLQRHAPPDGLSDHDAMTELYSIFDGPEQRALESQAARDVLADAKGGA